jgi:hypothetical protein
MSETGRNGRYSEDAGYEQLMLEAGTGVGRVLNHRQRYAATLVLQVFAYLMVSIPSEQVYVDDVVKLMKFYARGINNAEGKQG